MDLGNTIGNVAIAGITAKVAMKAMGTGKKSKSKKLKLKKVSQY